MCAHISMSLKRNHKRGEAYMRRAPDEVYNGEINKCYMKHGYGEAMYSNGNIFKGFWKNGKKHGLGIVIWPDDSYFSGEWKNGKCSHYGTLYDSESKLTCKGKWSNNYKDFNRRSSRNIEDFPKNLMEVDTMYRNSKLHIPRPMKRGSCSMVQSNESPPELENKVKSTDYSHMIFIVISLIIICFIYK